MTRGMNAILLVFFLLLASLVLSCSDQGRGLKVGESPGDFRLETFSHGRFYLNQQKGRITMLVFWATTCLGCKEEVIALKKVQAAFGPKGLSLAAVCIDPENTDLLAAIVKDVSPPFPVCLDRGAKLFRSLGLSEVPSTVIVDQNGKAAMIRIGYDAAISKQVKDKLAQLLSETPAR
ncbi:MAG: TlpA disulfide reductase family protein [Thermodesulfobacteriota bacterium]